jgi:hypothetical protein
MLVDWRDVEERLLAWSRGSLQRFVQDHPDAICSFVAYGYNTDAGLFQLALDTPDNALQEGQRTEREAIARRRSMLSPEWGWRAAAYFSVTPRVVDYAPHAGAFAYHVEPALAIDALRQLQSREDYPPSSESEDDYAQGNARVVIWRVVERLVEEDASAQVQMAPPFRVGYQIDDDELVVLRILAWPSLARSH